MSDDLTKKRKDRFEKLELLQELYYILHRNCLEMTDDLLKRAIKSKWTGKLELRIDHGERHERRRDLLISMRLVPADYAERADAVYYPAEHQALVDMYQRLQTNAEDVADGPAPKENVAVFDVAAGKERTP